MLYMIVIACTAGATPCPDVSTLMPRGGISCSTEIACQNQANAMAAIWNEPGRPYAGRLTLTVQPKAK